MVPNIRNTELSDYYEKLGAENQELAQVLQKYDGFSIVKVLAAGSQFGEIALMQNVQRQATIVTVRETHLATLTAEDYNLIIQSHY